MSLITERDILEESRDNFLTYASEVLTDRAIPSVEDGLLSAQRKILWTMEEFLKMDAKSTTKKCNAIVGSTLMTAYFHGDASCYGVLCKMSQDYLMRYPLIIGQGSLGTQENNELFASSRYTEAKPSKFTDLLMTDFKKGVVPLKETYNGEYMEPVMLPGLFPNAICNGRQAIGLSMAHNSIPHNLTEVCNAIIAYIQKDGLTLDELLEIMPGPDFPLANTIINKADIREAFRTGHSTTSLKIRGQYEIKGNQIIFNTIPYRTYRNKIKEQIEKNIDKLEKVLDDFNDESNLGQNKLVFTITKGIDPEEALEYLWNYTDLQSTVSYNMNFIVNGTPKMCSMLDLIKYYIEHQINVLLKATEYDRDKAEKRKHILEGLLLILDNIDTAIELIKTSSNVEEAKNKLIKRFSLDEIQAKAILDMKLSRLTKLDRDNLLKELEEKKLILAECERIINESDYRNLKLIEKVTRLRDQYGDARRTELTQIELKPKAKEIKEKPVVIPEKCVVIMTESGQIKRIPAASFKMQRRNSKGVKSQDAITKEVIRTNTVDTLMIFSSFGKMYSIPVNDIPEGTNTSEGAAVRNLVPMESAEKPIVIYSVYKDTDAKYVFYCTKKGLIKKTALTEYTASKRKTGSQVTKFNDGDALQSVFLADNEDILIISKNGLCIRFSAAGLSPAGKASKGVKGINLAEGDEVVAALPIRDTSDNLAVFAEDGCGKRIALNTIPVQNKGGKGTSISKETVASAVLLNDSDSILVVGNKNNLCISGKDIPVVATKTAQGNIMIKNNKIVSVSKV